MAPPKSPSRGRKKLTVHAQAMLSALRKKEEIKQVPKERPTTTKKQVRFQCTDDEEQSLLTLMGVDDNAVDNACGLTMPIIAVDDESVHDIPPPPKAALPWTSTTTTTPQMTSRIIGLSKNNESPRSVIPCKRFVGQGTTAKAPISLLQETVTLDSITMDEDEDDDNDEAPLLISKKVVPIKTTFPQKTTSSKIIAAAPSWQKAATAPKISPPKVMKRSPMISPKKVTTPSHVSPRAPTTTKTLLARPTTTTIAPKLETSTRSFPPFLPSITTIRDIPSLSTSSSDTTKNPLVRPEVTFGTTATVPSAASALVSSSSSSTTTTQVLPDIACLNVLADCPMVVAKSVVAKKEVLPKPVMVVASTPAKPVVVASTSAKPLMVVSSTPIVQGQDIISRDTEALYAAPAVATTQDRITTSLHSTASQVLQGISASLPFGIQAKAVQQPVTKNASLDPSTVSLQHTASQMFQDISASFAPTAKTSVKSASPEPTPSTQTAKPTTLQHTASKVLQDISTSWPFASSSSPVRETTWVSSPTLVSAPTMTSATTEMPPPLSMKSFVNSMNNSPTKPGGMMVALGRIQAKGFGSSPVADLTKTTTTTTKSSSWLPTSNASKKLLPIPEDVPSSTTQKSSNWFSSTTENSKSWFPMASKSTTWFPTQSSVPSTAKSSAKSSVPSKPAPTTTAAFSTPRLQDAADLSRVSTAMLQKGGGCHLSCGQPPLGQAWESITCRPEGKVTTVSSRAVVARVSRQEDVIEPPNETIEWTLDDHDRMDEEPVACIDDETIELVPVGIVPIASMEDESLPTIADVKSIKIAKSSSRSIQANDSIKSETSTKSWKTVKRSKSTPMIPVDDIQNIQSRAKSTAANDIRSILQGNTSAAIPQDEKERPIADATSIKSVKSFQQEDTKSTKSIQQDVDTKSIKSVKSSQQNEDAKSIKRLKGSQQNDDVKSVQSVKSNNKQNDDAKSVKSIPQGDGEGVEQMVEDFKPDESRSLSPDMLVKDQEDILNQKPETRRENAEDRDSPKIEVEIAEGSVASGMFVPPAVHSSLTSSTVAVVVSKHAAPSLAPRIEKDDHHLAPQPDSKSVKTQETAKSRDSPKIEVEITEASVSSGMFMPPSIRTSRTSSSVAVIVSKRATPSPIPVLEVDDEDDNQEPLDMQELCDELRNKLNKKQKRRFFGLFRKKLAQLPPLPKKKKKDKADEDSNVTIVDQCPDRSIRNEVSQEEKMEESTLTESLMQEVLNNSMGNPNAMAGMTQASLDDEETRDESLVDTFTSSFRIGGGGLDTLSRNSTLTWSDSEDEDDPEDDLRKMVELLSHPRIMAHEMKHLLRDLNPSSRRTVG